MWDRHQQAPVLAGRVESAGVSLVRKSASVRTEVDQLSHQPHRVLPFGLGVDWAVLLSKGGGRARRQKTALQQPRLYFLRFLWKRPRFMLSRDRLLNGRLPSEQTVIGPSCCRKQAGRGSLGAPGTTKKDAQRGRVKKYRGCACCKTEVGPLGKRGAADSGLGPLSSQSEAAERAKTSATQPQLPLFKYR